MRYAEGAAAADPSSGWPFDADSVEVAAAAAAAAFIFNSSRRALNLDNS